MQNHEWTKSQRQHARKCFDMALQAELAEIMSEYKTRVAAVEMLDQMWEMSDFLNDKAREIDQKYLFRYSGLDMLFARLINEKRLTVAQLEGIPEENMDWLRRFNESMA